MGYFVFSEKGKLYKIIQWLQNNTPEFDISEK